MLFGVGDRLFSYQHMSTTALLNGNVVLPFLLSIVNRTSDKSSINVLERFVFTFALVVPRILLLARGCNV